MKMQVLFNQSQYFHNLVGAYGVRAIVFATDGTACSNGFASKATNKTQQKPSEIESSSVYKKLENLAEK